MFTKSPPYRKRWQSSTRFAWYGQVCYKGGASHTSCQTIPANSHQICRGWARRDAI